MDLARVVGTAWRVAWRVLFVLAVVVPPVVSFEAGSTGDTFYAGMLFFLGFPALVAWLLFGVGIWDTGQLRTLWRKWLFWGVPVAVLLACLPVTSWAEDRSASLSRERLEEFAEAAVAHRSNTGRFPQGIAELRSATGRDLPEPSWGRGWEWSATEDVVRVRLWKLLMIDRVGWEWDTGTRTWTYWTDD